MGLPPQEIRGGGVSDSSVCVWDQFPPIGLQGKRGGVGLRERRSSGRYGKRKNCGWDVIYKRRIKV